MPARFVVPFRRPARGGILVCLLLAAWVARVDGVRAQETETGFLDRVYTDADGEHKYVVFVPRDYSADRDWPVILFLHGAGERGSDGQLQVHVGLGPAIRAREDFPFIAAFPQAEDVAGPARQAWLPAAPDGRRALAILDEVEKRYRTDEKRVYLTGLSMGGFGAWGQAAAAAERWAAIVPICGGGDPALADKLRDLPIWCFHGAKDRAVPVDESRAMVDAIEAAGGNPLYTEYPDLEHNCWDAAYGDDALYAWLLEQRRGEKASTTLRLLDASSPAPLRLAEDAPFIPVLEIPAVAFVRLDNDALAAIGNALPRMAEADALSGRLPDTETTTQSQVGPMRVRFSDLSYSGRLGRASLQAQADGRLAVTLRARNVRLSIGRTTVSGSGRSAVCGPMTIVLGHRYDLIIRCRVEPVLEGQKLRLRLAGATFRIPRDNWNVGSPAWVDAQGAFMTGSRVSSSLREGFYAQPRRIEEQVISALPGVLERLESELRFDAVDDLVVGMWPLPVYRPRVRSWPSAVRCDDDGVTLELGVSVAALTEEQAAAGLRQVELHADEGRSFAGGNGLRFGLAPDLMGPISELLVDAGVARVLVVDAPLKGLLPLADAAALAEIFPDLAGRGPMEVRSELLLTEAVRMTPVALDGPSNVGDGGALELALPRVVCAIAIRPSAEGEFVPYAEIDFGIRQRAVPTLQRPTPATRALALVWQSAAEIEVAARFAEDVSPSDATIDVDRIREIVAAGWSEWTETGPLSAAGLADLELGQDRLRAQAAGWTSHYLTAEYRPAGVAIRNATEGAVEYEAKGPYTGWGGPYRLPPGDEHRYAVAYPLTCRFDAGGARKMYTLGSGLRLEFRRTASGDLELYALPDRPAEQGDELDPDG